MMRSAIRIYSAVGDLAPKSPKEEIEALDRVAEMAIQARAAIMSLGWDAASALEYSLVDLSNLTEVCKQLEALACAAESARGALAPDCKPGRPLGRATWFVWLLADIIEDAGGTVDAKQGGELVQAFGVADELLGLSVKNHRETVRAALAKRPAKQMPRIQKD